MMNPDNQKLPGNREFGIFLAVLLFVCGAYFAYLGDWLLFFVLMSFSVVTLLVTGLFPDLLAPLNKGWMAIGNLLGRIVSPIVVGAIFLLIVVPVGLLGRLFGRDALGLRAKGSASYWVQSSGRDREKGFFKDQF